MPPVRRLSRRTKERKGFKRYFVTGLLVVVPVYITIYVLSVVIGALDRIFNVLPEFMRPDTYLPFYIPGLGVIVTVVGIFFIGIITTNFLGKKLVTLGESFMARLPVLRVIYNSTKQFMETFFKTEHDEFNTVVLVEFPRKGAYSMGFVTGRALGELAEKAGEDRVNVFVPTTPNPTSGFFIMVPKADVRPLDMHIEDAFKAIMTSGMVVPELESVPTGSETEDEPMFFEDEIEENGEED